MLTFEKHHIVTEDDLDMLNHVNNVRSVQWVQDIAEEHWETHATTSVLDNYFWVLLKHQIEYKNPAVLGDVLRIITYVRKAEGVKSLRIVEIYDQSSDKLLTVSETTWCLISRKTMKPTRITQEIKDLFS